MVNVTGVMVPAHLESDLLMANRATPSAISQSRRHGIQKPELPDDNTDGYQSMSQIHPW